MATFEKETKITKTDEVVVWALIVGFILIMDYLIMKTFSIFLGN